MNRSEWLSKLKEPIRTKALINYMSENSSENNEQYNILSNALNCSFGWINSPEGDLYWRTIYNTLQANNK